MELVKDCNSHINAQLRKSYMQMIGKFVGILFTLTACPPLMRQDKEEENQFPFTLRQEGEEQNLLAKSLNLPWWALWAGLFFLTGSLDEESPHSPDFSLAKAMERSG